MKQFSLDIIGKSFECEVEREEQRFYVKVNGKKYEVTFEDDSGEIQLLAVDGGLYSVELEGEPSSGKIQVKVNERKRVIESANLFSTKISTREKSVAEGTKEKLAVEGEKGEREFSGAQKGVLAPLPGKVVAVKVNKGDEVKSGDVVVILEAMKMENEIVSNFQGKISDIRVKEGDTVDAEDVLVVIG
jgi:biotin carboxyl carrier protein